MGGMGGMGGMPGMAEALKDPQVMAMLQDPEVMQILTDANLRNKVMACIQSMISLCDCSLFDIFMNLF